LPEEPEVPTDPAVDAIASALFCWAVTDARLMAR
jgi:hypothetical protein